MSEVKTKARILGAELAAPVVDATITVLDAAGSISGELRSDERGSVSFDNLPTNGRLRIERDGFVPKELVAAELPSVVRLLEDRLIGYQPRLWFQPGETTPVYVHSSSEFRARLYRHGLVKEMVADLGTFAPAVQQAPDCFFVEHGLDWKETLSYTIPSTAHPGLFSLLLTAEGEEPFAIPMVVSTPPSAQGHQARILVLASTNTWQSYNTWGGRSRYRNFETDTSADYISVATPSLITRARAAFGRRLSPALKRSLKERLGVRAHDPEWVHHRLSIKRPYVNCALEEDSPLQPFTNHLAAGEWRVLAWLEREGFAYDIVSGAELHHDPDLLRHYRAVIFSTHCEYWSRAMYEATRKYHEHSGLWLVNISGNTMFREIDFYEDGSTRCISLSFADSVADETELIGVRFNMDDYSTCAPFEILEPNHWVFGGIPINADRPVFGGSSLNQNTPRRMTRYDPGRPGVENGLRGVGASGWETDKRSSTAPADMVRVARGMNRPGGADMLVREPTGRRGGVFTASSLVFGGALLIDTVASMLTRNVLTRAIGDEG
ncbi:hypothetical protein GF420_15350 [candidate division GN15 bacterium]|nr:hypothetical protein [candidate division GN15 bacterium]